MTDEKECLFERLGPTLGINGEAWISVYLYEPNKSPLGRITIMKSLIQAATGISGHEPTFFFVNYGDRKGPHLRFRVLNMEAKARAAIVTEYHLLLSGLQKHSLIRMARAVRYRPEVKRYGGPNLIGYAHKHFYQSSRWVIENANLLFVDYSKTLIYGAVCLVCFVMLSYPETPQRIAFLSGFAESFLEKLKDDQSDKSGSLRSTVREAWRKDRDSWIRIVHRAKSFLSNTPTAPSFIVSWLEIVKMTLSEVDRRSVSRKPLNSHRRNVLLSSLIHLHNNRLGIRNDDEGLICFCFLECEKLDQ